MICVGKTKCTSEKGLLIFNPNKSKKIATAIIVIIIIIIITIIIITIITIIIIIIVEAVIK